MELPFCVTGVDWPTVDDERELIERAKRDRHAFAALYREHCAAVAGYVYRRTGDPHVTEDLVAEVFLAVLRALPRYRCRGVPFRSWLYRIATNEVNRWAKRRRRDGRAALPEGVAMDAAREAGFSGNSADPEYVRSALLSLSPKYQTVLALHYLEGLTVNDVAKVTGWRIGTVKSRLSRARNALREKLSARR
jgi:RNA polymerase sigma-70 factor (ECF subfamily)